MICCLVGWPDSTQLNHVGDELGIEMDLWLLNDLIRVWQPWEGTEPLLSTA